MQSRRQIWDLLKREHLLRFGEGVEEKRMRILSLIERTMWSQRWAGGLEEQAWAGRWWVPFEHVEYESSLWHWTLHRSPMYQPIWLVFPEVDLRSWCDIFTEIPESNEIWSRTRKITESNMGLGVICLEAKRTIEISEGEYGVGKGSSGEGWAEKACEGGRESVAGKAGGELVWLFHNWANFLLHYWEKIHKVIQLPYFLTF